MPPVFFSMPITYLAGDPLLTRQPILAIGSNAAGRTETSLLATALLTRYPAALAAYGKLCRQGRLAPGAMWVWR
ncbi:MAG: hypothetical protein IT319_11145, partial [Anaerolineae bacterium]|nr:hypothetical protein [Anaerolineae bacterium]